MKIPASPHPLRIPPSPIQRRLSALVGVVILLALGMHVWLGFDCANRWTATHDEYWHLPIGFLNAKTGRFDYDNLNPPLIRVWAAIPLMFEAHLPESPDASLDAIGWGDAFLAANQQQYHQLLAAGRCMILLLSVMTGLVLVVWSWEMFGRGAALLTALLWSTEPTILAHASLVTTDIGAAFFFVLTLYALWKFARTSRWSWGVFFGVCLGLAQLAKFTSLLLYPLSLVLWFVYSGGEQPQQPPEQNDAVTISKRTRWLQWLVLLTVSGLVLNAGYLFRGSFSTLGSYAFKSQTLSRIAGHLESIEALPVPLPRDYLEGLDMQRKIMESEHPVFLDGRLRSGGFHRYYVMAMLYKLSHSLQFCLLLAVVWLVWPGMEPRKLRAQIAWLIPVAFLLLIASSSGMQLGIRYLLPIMPFLILFAGQTGRWLNWRWQPKRAEFLVIVCLSTLLAVRNHPHHLAYFNYLTRGPTYGRYHLLDSNIDWGQDLRGLKNYLDERQIQKFSLAYFGTFPPSALGMEYRLPTSKVPTTGWHAVSVNFVMGRPHVVREHSGTMRRIGPNEFGYFREFAPVAHIGESIDVFFISEVDVKNWYAASKEKGKR